MFTAVDRFIELKKNDMEYGWLTILSSSFDILRLTFDLFYA